MTAQMDVEWEQILAPAIASLARTNPAPGPTHARLT